MIVRDMSGKNHFEHESKDVMRQWTPLHKIRDVAQRIHSTAPLQRWQEIVLCKDAQVLDYSTQLGTLADPNGVIELSFARITPESYTTAQTVPLWPIVDEIHEWYLQADSQQVFVPCISSSEESSASDGLF